MYDCHAHLVFVTKYRRGVFTAAILDDCTKIMDEICRDFGCRLVEFGGEDDHVHLLVEFPASIQLSRLVNSLKGVSARLLRKTHGDHLNRYLWNGHLWSRSYYVGTAGDTRKDAVARYVKQQRTPR